MGSSQSTPAQSTVERRILEQLQAMRVDESNLRQQIVEKEYVSIENEKSPSYGSDTARRVVDISNAEKWEKQLLADPKNRLALNALVSNDVTTIVTRKIATLADTQTFNVKIPFEGAPITNQRASGRCWLFATTNIHRIAIMKKHNLKEFELSQAYLFFWDKLEKANWFLEQMIDTADEELESRIVQQLLSAPDMDGGQWDMAHNLVSKYGIVPQSLYPDSFNAMNSGRMGSIITTKLREDALILRDLISRKVDLEHLLAMKAKFLQEIHFILTLMLGPPPKPDHPFTWEYYSADGAFHSVSKTPLQLAAELSSPSTTRSLGGANVNSLFSLVNDPRHKYLTHLTVDRLGNVIGGRPITYINVDMTTMKAAAAAMLKAGLPVFFGCDSGKFSNSRSGIMDTKLFDFDLAFNCGNGPLTMTKAQRLRVGESAMTHAMVLTAVQIEKDPKDNSSKKKEKYVRWRVQNSWGPDAGEQGWFVMSDDWMDQFTYQIVVDPSFVSREVRDCLKQEPKVLPLWDPMGALA